MQIIACLDDAAVSSDGCAVYEVAYQVIWLCLVEDSALFLRYILERLTRDRQDQMWVSIPATHLITTIFGLIFNFPLTWLSAPCDTWSDSFRVCPNKQPLHCTTTSSATSCFTWDLPMSIANNLWAQHCPFSGWWVAIISQHFKGTATKFNMT